MNRLYTFDDILVVPQYSDIDSREGVNVSTELAHYKLDIPIIAANMDTVCEFEMALAMLTLGGLGVVHRYMSREKQLEIVENISAFAMQKEEATNEEVPVAAAVGIKDGVDEHVSALVGAGTNIIVIDVAHGHHKQVGETIKKIKSLSLKSHKGTPIEVVAGNIASPEGAMYLFDAGADTVKVGVGSGSICSTRIVTGHGIPQASALLTIDKILHKFEGKMIADGGIRTSGDIIKAMALGSSAVMLGSLLAGTDEAPGDILTNQFNKKIKIYRGMASRDAQLEFFGNDPLAPEGVSVTIDYKGSVLDIIPQLISGIKSGLSYSGARSFEEFRNKAQLVVISESSLLESRTL